MLKIKLTIQKEDEIKHLTFEDKAYLRHIKDADFATTEPAEYSIEGRGIIAVEEGDLHTLKAAHTFEANVDMDTVIICSDGSIYAQVVPTV